MMKFEEIDGEVVVLKDFIKVKGWVISFLVNNFGMCCEEVVSVLNMGIKDLGVSFNRVIVLCFYGKIFFFMVFFFILG